MPASTSAADGTHLTTIRKQIIVNDRREVFGYELFHGSLIAGSHTAASDAALLFNAVTYSGDAMGGDAVTFVNCTHESLLGGHLDLVAPHRVVLEIPTLEADADADKIEARRSVLAALRDRGFRLAFDHTLLRRAYTSWLPLADFIKLDMLTLPVQSIPAFIKFAQTYTRAQLVAERLETEEQFAQMQALGVQLFQGYLIARPEMVNLHIVRPPHAHVCRLMQLVRSTGSNAAIERLIKQSPVLYFNLLRLIHVSGFQTSQDEATVAAAIRTLEGKKLFHWAALLMATSRPTDLGHPASQNAVVRGHLMELLAQQTLHPQEAEIACIVGLFSLLGDILGMPLSQALSSVSLPPGVAATLLHRKGIFAPLLDLCIACEQENEKAFAENGQALQLSNHQINLAYLHALAWADEEL